MSKMFCVLFSLIILNFIFLLILSYDEMFPKLMSNSQPFALNLSYLSRTILLNNNER